MHPPTITPTSRPDLGAKADADVRKELSEQAARHMRVVVDYIDHGNQVSAEAWIKEGKRGALPDVPVLAKEATAAHRRAMALTRQLNSQIASDTEARRQFVEAVR